MHDNKNNIMQSSIFLEDSNNDHANCTAARVINQSLATVGIIFIIAIAIFGYSIYDSYNHALSTMIMVKIYTESTESIVVVNP